LSGLGKRAGFIIMTVDSLEEAQHLVASDPFAIEGLIDDLEIPEWNPIFGSFAKEARGRTVLAPALWLFQKLVWPISLVDFAGARLTKLPIG